MRGESASASPSEPPTIRVRVWDLPTRMFHWLLVALVAFNVYSGNVGGMANMDRHMLAGYTILALVLFRLAWGIVGSRHSRFVNFIRGPVTAFTYLRDLWSGRHQPSIGHNPLGGWSVAAMLLSLLVQAATGLFANDEILTKGPLAGSVSKATSRLLTGVHEINATLLYVLIALHLAAVSYYVIVRRESLIRPMLTGIKRLPPALARVVDARGVGTEERFASPLLAAVLLLLAAGAVWLLVGR
ncbi:MAG: cytochrome b/b6 domain-containing protein [Rhodospirillales bacterium]